MEGVSPIQLRHLTIFASCRNQRRAHFKWWLMAAICFTLLLSSKAQSEKVPEAEYMKFVVNATEFPPEDYYDFLIVGGGTSGCPLAATLSENYKVFLIELLSQEGFWPTLMQFNRFDVFTSADVLFTSEEGVPNARGRILGGSSAIYAGFYSRADAEFYGDPGLVNQSYEWVEREVVFRPELRNWQSAVRDGLVEAGVGDFTLDHVVGTEISGPTFDSSGRHHSFADLLIHGIPSILKIAVHASVERILPARSPASDNSNLSAIGVVFRDNNFSHYHHAAMVHDGGEIILSAGAIGSPQLLLLSGIGSRPYLSSWGIPVARHDNPRNGISILPSVPLEHSLILAVGITGSGTFLEATSNVLIPFTSTTHFFLFTRGVPPQPLYLTVAIIMEKVARPISSGSLRLASTDDVKFNPVVRFNYLSDPTDLKTCVSGLRKIGDSRAMQDFKVRQWPLGPDFRYIGPRLPPSNLSDDGAMSELWHYHGGCHHGFREEAKIQSSLLPCKSSKGKMKVIYEETNEHIIEEGFVSPQIDLRGDRPGKIAEFCLERVADLEKQLKNFDTDVVWELAQCVRKCRKLAENVVKTKKGGGKKVREQGASDCLNALQKAQGLFKDLASF